MKKSPNIWTSLKSLSHESSLTFVRLSAPYLKKELKTALSHRNAILNNSIRQKPAYVKREKPNLYGEDIKIVSKITRRPKFLTDAEKDGMVEKYKAGLTVKKIADLYGCCNSTVRKELRQRGVIN